MCNDANSIIENIRARGGPAVLTTETPAPMRFLYTRKSLVVRIFNMIWSAGGESRNDVSR